MPFPRTVAPPTPWVPPLQAEKVSVLRFAPHPERVLWNRECTLRTVVRAAEVAPTILVTESLICRLRDSPSATTASVVGTRARSNRAGLCVDLSKVPSTARHARHMIVLHSDDSLEEALGGTRVDVEVNNSQRRGSTSSSSLRLWYGPAPDATTMRLKLELSVPKLELRCSRLASFPRLRGTRLAAELLRDGGRALGACFGLVALDENGEAVVLLEDDPTTRRVPIVGAWVSGLAGGADPCADPCVLEACAAKLFGQHFWFVDPDTALLLIFASKASGGFTPSFVEATAVYQRRTDTAAARVDLDFVADIDHRAPPPILQRNKRHRAILAARLLPSSTGHGGDSSVPPQKIITETPNVLVDPHPISFRAAAEPSNVVERSPAPSSRSSPSPHNEDDRDGLQTQLVELRRRLDELENKRQRPTGREMATETTDTLLRVRSKSAVERATETTDTLLKVRKPPPPPSLLADDVATDTNGLLPDPVEHNDVEVACDIAASQYQQSLESPEMQPETSTPAPCHSETINPSAFDEDLVRFILFVKL